MRRLLRWCAWLVLGGLLALGVLGGLGYLLATRVPALRERVAVWSLDVLRREADVHITVGHIESLDPFYADLRDVRAEIPIVGLVVTAEQVRVGFRPWALLSKEVHFSSAWISGANAVFGPPVKKPESEAESESEASESGDAWRVEIHDIGVHASRLAWHGMPGYTLLAKDVKGDFAYQDAPSIAVTHAEFELFQGDVLSAHIASITGGYTPEHGGQATLLGDVSGAPFEINLALPDAASITLPVPFERVDAQVKGLGPDVLVRLGIEQAQGLRMPLDAKLDFELKPTRYDLGLALESASARLELDGWLSKTLLRTQFALQLNAPSLAKLHQDLPDERAAVRLEAQVQARGDEAQASLAFRELQYGPSQLAFSGMARGALSRAGLRVDHFALRHRGGELEGSGRYQWQSGAAHAQVRTLAFALGPVGTFLGVPLAGVLSGTFELTRNVLGVSTLRATGLFGSLRIANALSVQRLSFDVQGTQKAKRPELYVMLRGEGLRAAGLFLSRARVRAVLLGSDLSAQLLAVGADTDLSVDLAATFATHDLLGDIQGDLQMQGRLFGQKLTLKLDNFARRAGALELSGLSARLDDAALRGEAELGAAGGLRVALELRVLPLGLLARSLGQPSHARFQGTLSSSLRLTGTLARPSATATFELNEAAFGSMPALTGHAAAAIDGEKGLGRLQLALQGGTGTLLEARSEVRWPQRSALTDLTRLSHSRNYLSLRLPYADLPHDVGLPALEQVELKATLNLESNADDVQGQVKLSAREVNDATPELEWEAVLDKGRVVMQLEALDGAAQHAKISAHASLELPQAGLLGLLTGSEQPAYVQADARYNVPSLRRVEGVLGQLLHNYQLDVPIGAVGDGQATLRAGKLEARLQSTLDVRSAALDSACGDEKGAQGRLEVALANEQIKGSLQLEGQGGGNGYAQFELPLAVLLGSSADLKGELRLNARGENLPLSSLPYLCTVEAGTAGFSLRAQVREGRAPEARLKLRLDGLSTARASALSSQISVRAQGQVLQFNGAMQSQGQERAEIDLALPLRYRGLTPGIALNEPVQGQVKLRELPVAPFMQLIDGLGSASGTLSGDVKLSGTLKAPRPEGELTLDRVSFVVASLAQPVRDVSGRIQLRGDKLSFRDLEAHDREGTLKLTGKADLQRDGSANAEFNLKTEQLPVRRQGKIMGKLSLGADVTAKLDRSGKLNVDAGIRYGTLQFLGTTGKPVQDLDAHPDVELKRAQPEHEEGEGKDAIALRSLELKSKQDLWIRHRDFNVQLGVDLSIVPKGDTQVLVGEARIARGNLKLLGKSFTIQRGAVRFTEDSDEPELDLRATFDPPAGGLPLSVQIAGRVSQPVLSFSGAADNTDKALAILSGMNAAAAAATAQADANAFGLGLTAGLVSMTARQELGAWVPTLSVGANSRGEASQARAGFDASKLIPPALRRFARGAYVEGIVGQTREGPGGSVGLGVRFELSLPRSVVTTVTYGPGTNWSADVAWVP